MPSQSTRKTTHVNCANFPFAAHLQVRVRFKYKPPPPPPPPPKKKERERKKKCWDADINTLHLYTRFLLHIMMGQKRTCTLIFFLFGGAGEGGERFPSP